MLRSKLLVFAVILLSFGLFMTPDVWAAGNDIKLTIDGNEITGLSMPPVNYKDRVLVPAREVFENLGAAVEWRAEERAVHITYKNQLLIMIIDSNMAFLDGIQKEMYLPAMIMNGKTMIPLRFPAECFGFEVTWKSSENTVYISTPVPEVPAPEVSVPGVSVQEQSPSEIMPSVSPARDVSASEITVAAYPQTTVVALQTPKETRAALYSISASSPISEVRKLLLADNRLVIDIYNAACALSGPFYVDDSVPVTGVRASQFMDEPKITRVVFDLKDAAEYSVTLSPDRTTLTVSFKQMFISGVTFSTDGISDAITITGSSMPSINVFPLTDPDRISIYISAATMLDIGTENVSGVYVTQINKWQSPDGTGCVDALIGAVSAYDFEYGVNTITVRFYKSTYQNIDYDRANRVIRISKATGLQINIDEVQHIDDYHNNRYLLGLMRDIQTSLGYGELVIRDGFIHSIIVGRDSNGLTQLTVNESRVLTFKAYEDDEYYYFKAYLPSEAYARVVVIDAGHGGNDPGSIGNGLNEKDINLGITLKLMQILESDNSIKAYATRMTDVYLTREERPAFANGVAHMFVSVHTNSATNNTSANGIEAWYWPHYNDATTGLTCQSLAEILNRRMFAALGGVNRGVKSDELIVLRDTVIPAALCEVGFISHPPEAYKLGTEEYQWQIAWAIYQGICEAFNMYRPL